MKALPSLFSWFCRTDQNQKPRNETTVSESRAKALKVYFGLSSNAELKALYLNRYGATLAIKSGGK